MKTVSIQNNTDIKKTKMFKVYLNGQEYNMDDAFLDIAVEDDTPVSVNVQNGRRGNKSLLYRFEPKEGLALRVSVNKQRKNRLLALTLVISLLYCLFLIFFQQGRFFGCVGGALIFQVSYYFLLRKSYFIVEEVSK